MKGQFTNMWVRLREPMQTGAALKGWQTWGAITTP